jgi:putative MATE family efflux protein
MMDLAPMTTNSPAAGAVTARTHQMLHAPLVATLFRLATPNVIGLLAMTVIIGYDGFILGRLGADALAGIALVLPLSMLMLQMSNGGMGGAVTAAVARALGGGRGEDAGSVAQHALVIACVSGLLFTLAQLVFGRAVYAAMGGRGAALEEAMAYANVLFAGAVVVWLNSALAATVRGSGNMLLPSLALLGTAIVHVALCPLLVFGWGPVQGLGIAGAAASTLAANALAGAILAMHLLRHGGAVHLRRAEWRWRTDVLRDILRVGLPASVSPVISNVSIAISTAFVGGYGIAALAGYGVAARLEYILVPIAFGFGTALTAMVATNMGAGQPERALRVAWTGGAVVAAITGTIGLAAALMPALWMNLFTTDAAVREFGFLYLNIVGGCYGLFGLGLALFFASQGAGRMSWPLTASAARLVVVAGGGWICVDLLQAPAAAFFFVVAASFVAYALTLTVAIRLGGWAR